MTITCTNDPAFLLRDMHSSVHAPGIDYTEKKQSRRILIKKMNDRQKMSLLPEHI